MDIFTGILMSLYSYVCLMWGAYAVKMQKKVNPNQSGLLMLLFVFIFNAIFCPCAIFVATITFDNEE